MTQRYKRPLTLEEMAKLTDDQIDTSDIPELDENFWKNAKVTLPRNKPNISLRLDEETIAYFKEKNPKGYTSKMAAVLAAYVNAHQR